MYDFARTTEQLIPAGAMLALSQRHKWFVCGKFEVVHPQVKRATIYVDPEPN